MLKRLTCLGAGKSAAARPAAEENGDQVCSAGIPTPGMTVLQGVRQRAGSSARPVLMALSNPSDVAECTARGAFEASNGVAVYASGTAFEPFQGSDGQQFRPSQVNNAFIFPGERPAAVVLGSFVVASGVGRRSGLYHSAGGQCFSN